MFSDYRAAFIILPFKIGQLYLYIIFFLRYINGSPLRYSGTDKTAKFFTNVLPQRTENQRNASGQVWQVFK